MNIHNIWTAVWLEAHYRRFNETRSSRENVAAMLKGRVPRVDDVRHMATTFLTDRVGLCGQPTDAIGHYQTIIVDQVTCPACEKVMAEHEARVEQRRQAAIASALVWSILALFPKPPPSRAAAVTSHPRQEAARPRKVAT